MWLSHTELQIRNSESSRWGVTALRNRFHIAWKIQAIWKMIGLKGSRIVQVFKKASFQSCFQEIGSKHSEEMKQLRCRVKRKYLFLWVLLLFKWKRQISYRFRERKNEERVYGHIREKRDNWHDDKENGELMIGLKDSLWIWGTSVFLGQIGCR